MIIIVQTLKGKQMMVDLIVFGAIGFLIAGPTGAAWGLLAAAILTVLLH